MGNATFTFDVSKAKEIVNRIKATFNIANESNDEKQNVISRLVLSNNQIKINVIFYGTGKCLIQGKDGEFFENIKSKINESEHSDVLVKESKQKNSFDENEIYQDKNLILGFDEAGKGEAIGPMVFGCVLLPKDKIHLFKNLKSDIKSLSLKELNYYCSLLKNNGIKFEHAIVSALEITNHPQSLNRLMDENYIGLIRKFSSELNPKYLLAIDDYTIKEEMQIYLEKLKAQGVEHICENSLDEHITATKLASVVARQIRLTMMEELSRINSFEYQGKRYSFERGANNEQTRSWLETYRLVHPNFEFPDFVRKNWKNVQEVEFRLPKNDISRQIECAECKDSISKILLFFNKAQEKMLYFCSSCNGMIDPAILKNEDFGHIICDTSAHVSGTMSKELEMPHSIFEGACIVNPFKILDEIETLPLSRKKGAHKELQKLNEIANQGKITVTTKDYEITDPFDADNKLYGMVAKNNSCCLVSGDSNLADSAHSNGAFVFKVIHHLPQQRQLDDYGK